MSAEDTSGNLLAISDIRVLGYLKKGNQVLALPTAFGTKRRIHGCTENLMMVSYEWEKGAVMPTHEHEVEQISYVVEGKMRVTLGDETFVAEKGDAYTEPKRITHSMEALEPSFTIEVFTPPRPLFQVLEAAARHDVHGAYEGVKKGMEASRRKRQS